MTRRERLEARADRRREWADKAEARSSQHASAAHAILDSIPPGQPVLVGHHSEGRHRRDLRRVDGHMGRAVEEGHKAENHASKAAGIEAQLERSIFNDDPDALEALAGKVAELEAERDRMKAANAAWRKAGKPTIDPENFEKWDQIGKAAGFTQAETVAIVKRIALCPYQPQPFPGYALTNIGGRIRQAKARAEDVQRRQARQERAEAAGGVVVEHSASGAHCQVTFAEKPDRAILEALKGAGFHWSGGSWFGDSDKLPQAVADEAAAA